MHGIHLCVVWVGLYWKAVDLHIVRISANQLSGDLHDEWCILGDGKEDQLGTAALDISFFQCNQTIGDEGILDQLLNLVDCLHYVVGKISARLIDFWLGQLALLKAVELDEPSR